MIVNVWGTMVQHEQKSRKEIMLFYTSIVVARGHISGIYQASAVPIDGVLDPQAVHSDVRNFSANKSY